VVAGSLYYAYENTIAGDLTEFLIKDTRVRIVCVVNSEMKALGIINREHILNLMGSKFGRELYFNRNINTLMTQAPFIYYKRSTFSVIEELKQELRNYEDKYYILTDSEDRFRGILSSKDITIYLSDLMTRDIFSARKVHKAIVKEETVLNNDKFEFTGASIMAGGIGGDFHTIRQLKENLWAVIFFDVSGKGIKAALISVAVSSMFSIYAFENDFTGFLSKVNSYIYDLFNGENFITGIFMIFDESTGEAKIYDMGHSLIYVMKKDRIFQLKSSNNNIPLGIQPEISPTLKSYKLEKNELFLSVSDGITEQNNYLHEPYGEKRLLALVLRNRVHGTLAIKDALIKDIAKYRHGQAQGDDMSVMILQYKSGD
jgi:sigma-B regulation protein RsbU (phosphoserine phosphatase)